MDAERAERQRKFIAMAATHAEDFKPRVAQHDRENSFPHENVAAMKASGYTNMTAPAELGGGGADILDEVLAQERLGRGDLPTAIAINMHVAEVRADDDTPVIPQYLIRANSLVVLPAWR
jgi:alkylation response protein AidB-like acyl-CoA dehydrogenase